MGGARLERQAMGVTPEGIDATPHMPEHPFSNARISIDSDSYEYSDCSTSCIGNGSFGQVFRGTDVTTGKLVAIKKMSRVNVKPNELKVMKAVRSRFLVGLIDICVDSSDNMFIIMELCDNDLDQHLRYYTESGSLSRSDLRLLIDNVVRGYKALYDCYIVHRDIKPQNILIKYGPFRRSLEAAKISDFGISRILNEERSDSLSNVAGTFYYMAPEVGANLLTTCEYDHQVDMWSLGCVFYQCITGEVPFDECSLCRIFLYTAGGNYEAYDKPELPDDMESDVERIVLSLLEIDSNKRVTPTELHDKVCAWSNNDSWLLSDDTSSCSSGEGTVSVACS